MERQHHWTAQEDALIRQHGSSMTAAQLQKTHLPWRTIDSVSHRRRLLRKPPKKRTRFSQKRLIGTTINGRKVTGISSHRSLIAVCERGHEVTLPQATLRKSEGCSWCKVEDNGTVRDEAEGRRPLTPERWLGKVIHGKTIVRIEGAQRVVVVCERGHEASPVFPCNVLKVCRTCRRERVQRLREEKWLGKQIGERTVLAVEKNKLLVECPEGHQTHIYSNLKKKTRCGECLKEEQAVERWIGYSAGGRTIVSIGPPSKGGSRKVIAECERGHHAAVGRAVMHKIRCQQCISEDSYSHYPEYSVWARMKSRCNNPNDSSYHRYGGRGIKVIFESFEEFYEHIGPRPSSEFSVNRINNDGNYELGNVEWATDKQQARNRSDNHNITHQGKTQCAMAWSEELGINYQKILHYSHKGHAPEEIFKLAAAPKLTEKDRLLTAHGSTKTWSEWSEEKELSIPVIRGRLKLGWTPEKIVDTPILKGHRKGTGRKIDIDGVLKTIREWSEVNGVNYITACARIHRLGWNPKRAVTEPVDRSKPRGPTFATRANQDQDPEF